LTQEYGSEKEFSSPTSNMVKPNKMQDIMPLYGITKLGDENGKEILREEVKMQVELKPLPSHLRYEFLKSNKKNPVVVSVDEQVRQLLPMLEK
jgi:hypothetical protein